MSDQSRAHNTHLLLLVILCNIVVTAVDVIVVVYRAIAVVLNNISYSYKLGSSSNVFQTYSKPQQAIIVVNK